MSWVSIVAIYFIFWWVVLFAILPFGLRTQGEDQDVTLGTEAGAPRGAHLKRAFVWTTIVSGLIAAAFFGVTRGLGYGFDDLPQIIPVIHTEQGSGTS